MLIKFHLLGGVIMKRIKASMEGRLSFLHYCCPEEYSSSEVVTYFEGGGGTLIGNLHFLPTQIQVSEEDVYSRPQQGN